MKTNSPIAIVSAPNNCPLKRVPSANIRRPGSKLGGCNSFESIRMSAASTNVGGSLTPKISAPGVNPLPGVDSDIINTAGTRLLIIDYKKSDFILLRK